MKNKIAVIIGARGIGDLIYHLPLLKSLHQSYNEELIIFSNRANKAKEVFKDEKFFKKIIYIDNHRYNPLVTIINSFKFKSFLNSYKIERIILTSNAKRLILPVLMSNAKIKNFFGTGKFVFTKDKKNDHLTATTASHLLVSMNYSSNFDQNDYLNYCKKIDKKFSFSEEELNKLNFKNGRNKLISNVTANEIKDQNELKNLLIKQIENRVRWRESVINMIKNDVGHFIEIGPGKVLSGLVKRISKDVKIDTINNQSDIENLKI